MRGSAFSIRSSTAEDLLGSFLCFETLQTRHLRAEPILQFSLASDSTLKFPLIKKLYVVLPLYKADLMSPPSIISKS